MDLKFMKKALEIAEKSGNDIPVGAVLVKDGIVLVACHNQKESSNDVTAHAEILAIREVGKKIGNWRLNECDLYVTLEPCPMCSWAIMQARVKNLYFGSYDSVYGAFSTLPEMVKIANSKLSFKGGIMESECDNILKEYFNKIREN